MQTEEVCSIRSILPGNIVPGINSNTGQVPSTAVEVNVPPLNVTRDTINTAVARYEYVVLRDVKRQRGQENTGGRRGIATHGCACRCPW